MSIYGGKVDEESFQKQSKKEENVTKYHCLLPPQWFPSFQNTKQINYDTSECSPLYAYIYTFDKSQIFSFYKGYNDLNSNWHNDTSTSSILW